MFLFKLSADQLLVLFDCRLRSIMKRQYKNVKNTKGLIGKTTTLHMHHAFLYISFLFLHYFNVTMPNLAFKEDTNKQ